MATFELPSDCPVVVVEQRQPRAERGVLVLMLVGGCIAANNPNRFVKVVEESQYTAELVIVTEGPSQTSNSLCSN